LPEDCAARDSITEQVPRPELIASRLLPIAELARISAGGFVCFVAYRIGGADGLARSSAGDSKWDPPASAFLGALVTKAELAREAALGAADADGPGGRPLIVVAAGAELEALCGLPDLLAADVSAVGCVRTEDPWQVRIVLLAPADTSVSELRAICDLASQAALSTITAEDREAARVHWRKRATDAAGQLARARSELEAVERREHALDGLIAGSATLAAQGRFAALGALIAASRPFEGWMLAIAGEEKKLEIVAASPGVGPLPPLDHKSVLRKCFAEQLTLAGPGIAGAGGGSHYEDRVFGLPYLCVAFERGAIALASRTPASEKVRAEVEATVRSVAPVVESWALRDELARERALVRRLALRMFAAVDEERGRIARDLHDDQAQLLAAARIALEGGRDEARGIFTRLEQELRRRVRELRPATLGRATLDDALAVEFRRLADAGIKARLLRRGGAGDLSRPVEQLFYQVAREALSNVIRHSGATRVRVVVEGSEGLARISVADNGAGFAPDTKPRGSGLAGLRERLELMGGSLRIDSRPGATRLVAEIPDFA
jgi:Histidine kinase-, DNA gyrase B-, and HSP90-like ATPase